MIKRSAGNTDIDVILFDLGGVLVELAGVEKMLEWSKELGSTDELWRRWLGSDAVRAFETGRIGTEEFAQRLVGEFGVPVPPAEFLQAFDGWPRALFPGAKYLLAELAPHHRLASVSNTNELHWARFTNEWTLDQSFHHNFPSHHVGRLKPDADYFEHVLDAMGAPASRVLFVDDNAINVAAAAQLGMVTRRVVGVAGARAAMHELGLLRA